MVHREVTLPILEIKNKPEVQPGHGQPTWPAIRAKDRKLTKCVTLPIITFRSMPMPKLTKIIRM